MDAEDSALDMEDDAAIPPIDIRQRRSSNVSRRRPSVSVTSTRTQATAVPPTSSPSTSPRKPELTASPGSTSTPLPHPSPPPAPPRMRTHSVLSRALDVGSAPSPLAQVFLPLNVSDELQLEGEQQLSAAGLGGGGPGTGPIAGGGAGVLSYGPATRRRLSSIHPQRRTNTGTTATGDSFAPPGLRRFPSGGVASPVSAARVGGLAGQVLSESPDDRDDANPGSDPAETAGQIEEEGAGAGLVERRLDQIVERQRRMEELLMSLAAGMQQQTPSG
jgi:hypothetical protein